MLRPVKSRNPMWAELIQLVPVISLALPFVVQGSVDLRRAASGFMLGASLFVVISWLIVRLRHVLNPIAVGSGVWLVAGALAFGVPIAPLEAIVTSSQGFSLFVTITMVGLAALLLSPQGFIGHRTTDRAFVVRASLVLLALSVGAAAWAFRYRADIRVGGGLPFILLNVARRVLIRRAR
jgi:hypothetical protein